MRKYLIGIGVFLLIFFAILSFNQQISVATPTSTTTITTTATTTTNGITMSDVANHNVANDCWTVINGSVYNITEFIPLHPGGSIIVRVCGKDGTDLYNRVPIHAEQGSILGQYYIGKLSS